MRLDQSTEWSWWKEWNRWKLALRRVGFDAIPNTHLTGRIVMYCEIGHRTKQALEWMCRTEFLSEAKNP